MKFKPGDLIQSNKVLFIGVNGNAWDDISKLSSSGGTRHNSGMRCTITKDCQYIPGWYHAKAADGDYRMVHEDDFFLVPAQKIIITDIDKDRAGQIYNEYTKKWSWF